MASIDEILVFMTARSEGEGASIARALVEAGLAGCVNIIRDVRSIYSWQGNTEDEKEVLMIAKTRRELFKDLETRVKELHSYTVPEIVAVQIDEGSKDYLKWLGEATVRPE